MFAEANMLYLETPAGVGFSYSANSSFYFGANDMNTGMFASPFRLLPLERMQVLALYLNWKRNNLSETLVLLGS